MALLEIHRKITVWEKIIFPDTVSKEEVLERLKQGENPDDIGADYDAEYSTDYETSMFMTPEENSGRPTVELMVYDSSVGYLKPVWNNKATE